MALTLADTQAHFRRIGKMIYISQQAPTFSATIKKTVTGLVAQDAEANADQYDQLNKVYVVFNSNMKNKLSGIDGMARDCSDAVKLQLQQVVAVDLGLAAGASIAAVGTALAARMNSVSATVDPSGAGGSNSDGIAMYFADNFGIELPQDGSANIPDTYIDDDIVAS